MLISLVLTIILKMYKTIVLFDAQRIQRDFFSSQEVCSANLRFENRNIKNLHKLARGISMECQIILRFVTIKRPENIQKSIYIGLCQIFLLLIFQTNGVKILICCTKMKRYLNISIC